MRMGPYRGFIDRLVQLDKQIKAKGNSNEYYFKLRKTPYNG